MITEYDRVVNEIAKLREQVRRHKAAAKRVRKCETHYINRYSQSTGMLTSDVLAALRLKK